jgi:hypothetical protein
MRLVRGRMPEHIPAAGALALGIIGLDRFDTARLRLQSVCNSYHGEIRPMAKLALIYGMRLLPEEDLGELRDATVVLKNGRTARVTMHLIEGSKEEIEATFHQSVQAFFEMYPEI